MISCGLEHFTAADARRATAPLDKMLDLLVERDVDIINQTGVPLPLLIGMEAHDALIKHIEDYTGKTASSQLLNVLAALEHLGIKKVLAVNKWREDMNDTLKAFLKRGGMELVGVSNNGLAPAEFSKINAKDSAQMAYDLAVQGARRSQDPQWEFEGCESGGLNVGFQPILPPVRDRRRLGEARGGGFDRQPWRSRRVGARLRHRLADRA